MKRKRSRVTSLLAMLLAVMVMFASIPGMAEAKSKIKINVNNITLQMGKTRQLSLAGISQKANKKVAWKSSKKSVASVSAKGRVKAKKRGTTVISAKYKGRTYRCKVKVVEKSNASAKNMSIRIAVGKKILYAKLDGSKMAKQFVKSLPQTISMQRVGDGREFYGDLNKELDYNKKDSQTTFENGDIAYWYSGNGLCLLYNNQVKNPEIKSGIIVFGKITSDLSVFYDLDDDVEVTISLA